MRLQMAGQVVVAIPGLVALLMLILRFLARRRVSAGVARFCRVDAKKAGSFALSGKRVLAIVNPHSGSKRGLATFREAIRPMFEAAGATVDMVATSRGGEATELAHKRPEGHNVVLVMGGDGTAHEVLNGLMRRPDVQDLALALVPVGSSNGICKSLTDLDLITATKQLVAGSHRSADVISITPLDGSGPPVYEPMFVGYGMTSDVNILQDTRARWMHAWPGGRAIKDLFLQLGSIVANTHHPVRMTFLPAPAEPEDARNGYNPLDAVRPCDPPEGWAGGEGQWYGFTDDVGVVVISNLAWIDPDLQNAPGQSPETRSLDLLVTRRLSRVQLVSGFLKMSSGDMVKLPYIERYRVSAVTLEPQPGAPGSTLMAGGELLPMRSAVVRCLPGAAAFWY